MLQKILLFCCFLIAVSCTKKVPETARKPLLLVSIAPYQFLAERVAGEGFEVKAVVPGAANPHSFEPTAGQVREIGRGLVWFTIGEPFEGKVLSVLKNLAARDLRDGIEMIEEGQGCHHCCSDHFDRHIWMSPRLAGKQAAIIADELSERFPEQKDLFMGNLARLVSELDVLDKEVREILGAGNRAILVSHPAFGYFCNEYGLEQLSVEFEGKDPRPGHLEELLKSRAEIAFAMPQYNNKGAQLIAAELGLPLETIDPYSADYLDMMRSLAHMIADANRN
jgi:zinc transport system substrate-binding protein